MILEEIGLFNFMVQNLPLYILLATTWLTDHLVFAKTPPAFPDLLSMSASTFLRKWAKKCASELHSALSFVVFLFFDLLEIVLCVVYRYLDAFFEGQASLCYCANKEDQARNGSGVNGGGESEVSETLYGRRNVFREMGLLSFVKKFQDCQKCGGADNGLGNRWSDCGCESCTSWMRNVDHKLHVVMQEAVVEEGKRTENVIFIHGFLASSLLWTETVFHHLPECKKHNYRFLAVDLLGFGRSPKPRDCYYTLKDHVEMIEKSVIFPFQLNSFHLVGHSMGCIITLALAAKYSKIVKSVTLVAPPYLPSSKDGASLLALESLAGKKLWPPLAFGSSVMSWYEHIGRCVCFFVCRNHRTWERILKLVTRTRDLHFMVVDLTRHTHHSAWHSMHNVICGGAKSADGYLETLIRSGVKVCAIQGDRDPVVPPECCKNMKMKFPEVEMKLIADTDHITVIMSREKDFVRNLEEVWASSADITVRTGDITLRKDSGNLLYPESYSQAKNK